MTRLSGSAQVALAALAAAGAVTQLLALAADDLPGASASVLASLVKRRLVASVQTHGALGPRLRYHLTPLGQMAVMARAQASKPAKAATAKVAAPRRGRRGPAPAAPTRFDVGQSLRTFDQITAPGCYRMASEVYHADPCPAPALSSSLAHTLLTCSPAHAYAAHPRLGGARGQTTGAMDIGSAVHAFALGDVSDIVLIDADDWRDGRTRNWRDAARQQGKVPLLRGDKARVVEMASRLRPVLEAQLDAPISDGLGEVVIACLDGPSALGGPGGWRRTRADLIRSDARVILDVKTTAGTAEPSAMSRKLVDQGGLIQQALTCHILDALDPAGAGRRVFRFVAIEQEPPHAVSVIEFDGAAREIAGQQLAYACAAWDACVASGAWPGFSGEVHRASLPGWQREAWLSRAYALGLVDAGGEPIDGPPLFPQPATPSPAVFGGPDLDQEHHP